jgi:hypothetical protein
MVYKILKYAVVDDEIINAVVYYESISPVLGLRFETSIEDAFDELEPILQTILTLRVKSIAG